MRNLHYQKRVQQRPNLTTKTALSQHHYHHQHQHHSDIHIHWIGYFLWLRLRIFVYANCFLLTHFIANVNSNLKASKNMFSVKEWQTNQYNTYIIEKQTNKTTPFHSIQFNSHWWRKRCFNIIVQIVIIKSIKR